MTTETSVGELLAVTPDLRQGKINLDRLGYTIHPGFLTPQQVETLQSRLEEQAELEREQDVALISSSGHAGSDRHIGGRELSSPPVHQLVELLPNKGRAFIELMMHPLALSYAEHAFRGARFNLATQAGMLLRRGGKQQVVHIDQQAWPFATPIPVMLNVMICLVDFEANMGATCILPGSHLGDPPSINGEIADAVALGMIPMTAPAGSALIWESRTWHCQGTHTSDKLRASIASVYATHFTKPQDFYPASIHDDVYDTLSDEEKRMLGFEVVHEYAGRIGPRNPFDGRTNTNIRRPFIPELRRDGVRQAVAKPGRQGST